MIAGNLSTSCWDESGTDPGTSGEVKSDCPIILVGGYIAHVKEWVDLDEKWAEVLGEYELEYFRMAQFANRRWPYSLWDDDKYNSLIFRLLDIIVIPRFRHAVAITVDDYREVVKADNIGNEDIVRAYHICARKCIEFISDLAREAHHATPLLHIFDSGNAAWPSFQSTFTDAMLEKLNILRPIEQSKKHVLGLQAADVLAHQSARQVLIDTQKIISSQRLYTNRLYKKPGFTLCATRAEVKQWYEEELYLEGERRRGRYPSRVTRIDMTPFQPILTQLFADNQDPDFVSALRSLQR